VLDRKGGFVAERPLGEVGVVGEIERVDEMGPCGLDRRRELL